MPAAGSSKNALGLGCLVLFALPFAGFGLFAAFQAVKLFGTHDWKQGLFLTLFAVVFSSVGFGLIAFGILGSKKLKQQQAIEAAHPDEPWLCREDWKRGEVKSAGKAGLVFIWIFALFWSAISSAVFFGILNQPNHGNAIYVVGLFPAAGALLLVWAIHRTLQWRRFGQSVFKLTTVPGVAGGALAGVVHTANPLYRASEIRLRLACFERDTSGDNTSERLQWEHEKVLTGEVLQGGGVPVVFNIPFDCQPTATLSTSRSIVWRLEVGAVMPGTDYAAQFEVPVFKTAQSRADAPELPDPAAAYEKRLDATPLPGIRIQPSGSGGTEFNFAAARNKSAGLGLLLFTAIWTGAIVFMIRLKAPVIFPIVFGLFEILLVLILSSVWTSASRVIVDVSGIQLTTRWMFFLQEKVSRGVRCDIDPAEDEYVVRLDDLLRFAGAREEREKYQSRFPRPLEKRIRMARRRDGEGAGPEMKRRGQHGWQQEIERVLITEEQIARRVRQLTRQLQQDFAGRDLVIVSLLSGTVMFLADLVRHLSLPLRLDFMGVSSYGVGTESGELVFTKQLRLDVRGRDVLVVDDILDTGRTLKRVVGVLREHQPRRVRVCVLLEKKARRAEKVRADYVGFQIPDLFVVGYGLDHAERYRNLPFVGVLRPEACGK